jgi:alpha-tubulin suppressor-like RCC1 family protein
LVSASDAIRVYPGPQCGSLADVIALTVGGEHACVLHAAGTIACWGERYYGQLGLGGVKTADVAPFGSDSPLVSGVTSLVAGIAHSCALLSSGAVVCFGLNSLGQVGPGASTRAEEVRAPAPVSGFAGRVVALGSGSSAQHTCAILGDGSVACWGSDHTGQLGDGVRSVDETRSSHGPLPVVW